MLPVHGTSRYEPDSARPLSSRADATRSHIRGLFTGRSTVGRPRHGARQIPDSPKTPSVVPIPRPVLGLRNMPNTRLVIPYLTRSDSDSRSYSRSESRSLSRTESSRTQTRVESRTQSRLESRTEAPPHSPRIIQLPLPAANSPRPMTPNSWNQYTQDQNHSTFQHHGRQDSTQRFIGVDPAEEHLANLADYGRRHRKSRRRRSRSQRKCAPKIKNPKIRTKILHCFISGMLLFLILTIYLALALSNKNERQEFHVLLIIGILVITIFFCHSLIRLCMMLIHPLEDHIPDLPEMVRGVPTSPIQVTLARDEEAAGIESQATKFPPPAYGLWRESVRIDPDRIYWQRNEAAAVDVRPATANRPPSYISEEGVDYILEAQPRSIAPTTNVPLPVHPSERGRVWHGP